jgi:ligand-binding sensor domain-containing protein/two-component sensor histidine kinase
VEDGLAQTQIFDLESDNDGYLWVGTAGGVSRFDGENFKNFTSENGLTDNTVKKIVNHNNCIWIASQYGITSVLNKKVISWDLLSIATGRGISSFTFDFDDNLWLAIKGKGVYRISVVGNQLNLKEITNFSLDNENIITTLYCDSKGRIWAGGKNILSFFEGGDWNKNTSSLLDLTLSSFSENKSNEFIFSTQEDGVFTINEGHIQKLELSENFGTINHLYTDRRDRLWISTNSGAFLLEDNEIKHFTLKNGLVNERIKNITEDREGNIWLGSDGGGILRYSSDELVSFSKADGLSSNYVLSILEDDFNNLYFSTYEGGINFFDRKKVSLFKANNQLADQTIWSSFYNLDSTFWFGTAAGLTIQNGSSFINYINYDVKNKKGKPFNIDFDFFKTPDTIKYINKKAVVIKSAEWLPSNKILNIYKDTDNNIWIGCSRGVCYISEDGKGKSYKYGLNFPTKNVRAIETVLNNEIWMGTSSGIYELVNDSILESKLNDELQNKIVYCIKKINDDLLFIGTGNGLYSYNGKQLKKIELHESFSANNINFIGIEDSNYVWVGTNYGVFEINVTNYLSGSENSIHHYSTSNGLPSIETNLNAFYKDSQGNIWMGTSKGVVQYKRKHEFHKVITPIVKIDKVQLFLKDTDWKKYSKTINESTKLPVDLSVSYKNNYFTFFYNGISIKQNKELRYSVILESFDTEWSPPVKQNSITFTNLSYGTYTFKVKATTDNLNWSEPTSFSFTIKKPYYLDLWFFLLVGVLILGITYLIWKWQVNVSRQKALTQKLYYKSKLLALEQQTLNASMNRHFIFNSLNSIQYYINTKDRLSANKYLTNFAKLIRKNLDSSISGTNLVTLTDELERLELYLSLENMRFQNKFSYNIEVEVGIDSETINVPPMFLQPYVENSIWHGILPLKKDGKIEVKLSRTEKNEYLFIIEDNGMGIDQSIANKKNNDHASKGMSITSGRLEILKKTTNQEFIVKGPYQIEDKEGRVLGTRVEILIKQQ